MSVAIIGGGYAGMAAALTLSEAGVPVTVYEANSQLGGRARRVEVNGVTLDNGLHILACAYHETLRLVNARFDAGRGLAPNLEGGSEAFGQSSPPRGTRSARPG